MDGVQRATQRLAERHRVDQAARALRHEATQARYAGFQRPEVAYGLASVLDLLALKWSDQPDDIRRVALEAADVLAPEAEP